MYKNNSPFKNKGAMQDLANQYMGAELINPFADMTNQYADMQNAFLDMPNFYDDLTNRYGNMTNRFEGLENTMSSLDNRFEGMQNQYTGMSNRFAGLENTMEDATINQKEAEFQRNMFQQSQANMLGDLRGAAGGSGVAALAQQLAQSGQIASQQASASIGAQEAQNQRATLAEASRLQGLEASEASRIDQLQRGEAGRIDQMIRQQAGALDMASAQQQASLDMASAQGQTALDMAAAQGQTALDLGWANQAQANEMAAAQGAWDIDQLIAGEQSNLNQMIAGTDFALQGMELDRLATALGMSQAEVAASIQQQSINNQANADSAEGAWNFILGLAGSDRKLKKNIKLIGYSPSGLKIYLFEYIDKMFGDGIYQGVMSDEIPQSAVIKHKNGYDMVDYSKIDVKFKKVI